MWKTDLWANFPSVWGNAEHAWRQRAMRLSSSNGTGSRRRSRHSLPCCYWQWKDSNCSRPICTDQKPRMSNIHGLPPHRASKWDGVSYLWWLMLRIVSIGRDLQKWLWYLSNSYQQCKGSVYTRYCEGEDPELPLALCDTNSCTVYPWVYCPRISVLGTTRLFSSDDVPVVHQWHPLQTWPALSYLCNRCWRSTLYLPLGSWIPQKVWVTRSSPCVLTKANTCDCHLSISHLASLPWHHP